VIIKYKINELDRLEVRLGTFKKDIISARAKVLAKYIRLLLTSHFLLYNGNSRYRKNSVEYEVQKAEKFGRLPQLVVSGYLKSRVLAGKVQGNGKLRFDLPDYGIYQIIVGRDFLRADSKEKRLMAKWLRAELKIIRSKLRK